ncbi:MAG TPA: septum formation initiator family protein [Eubacteriaceae bacterium]|nr:septum formation initiator family protein [Eubacteriaceae bacterium]
MASNSNTKYKRRKKRKIKRSTIILLLVMFTYFAYHYISLELRYRSLVRQRDELKANIEETEEYHQQLLEQVENSKTDKYIERLARKFFGLIYPDEKVYIEKEVGAPD